MVPLPLLLITLIPCWFVLSFPAKIAKPLLHRNMAVDQALRDWLNAPFTA